MIRLFSRFMFLVIPLYFCTPASAQQAQSGDDFPFVLSGMRNERLKVRSGVCRMTGQYVVRVPTDPSRGFEGPLTILEAFEGEEKIRFDRRQPGWVMDPTTVKAHPSGEPGRVISENKHGVISYKFFDNGKKAGFWSEEEPQINVMASLGSKAFPNVDLEYFDVRALGMYDVTSQQRQKHFKELFDSYAAMKVQTEIDRSDPAVWIIKWAHSDELMDSEVLISVDVRNGFTPNHFQVRHRSRKRDEGWHTAQEFVTKWEKRQEVWLPVSHNYIYTPSKGSWRKEVNFGIAWEKINEPIDPELFDYKGFSAPDRVGVVDTSLGQGIMLKPIGPPPAGASRWRIVSLFALALLALGAVVAGGVVLKRRRQARVG
jgi:hypothetical protein